MRICLDSSSKESLELGVGMTEGEALENFIDRVSLDLVLPSWEELELRMAVSGEKEVK